MLILTERIRIPGNFMDKGGSGSAKRYLYVPALYNREIIEVSVFCGMEFIMSALFLFFFKNLQYLVKTSLTAEIK